MKKEKPSLVVETVNALRQLLEGLVAVNVQFLKRHKKRTGEIYPSIYDVVPQYRKGDFGVWQDIASVTHSGGGDVCDLVCWRIAELRHEGYRDVRPLLKATYDADGGMTIVHVQVRIHDMIEDPSVILGSP